MASISISIAQFDAKRDLSKKTGAGYTMHRRIWFQKDSIVPGREHRAGSQLQQEGGRQTQASEEHGVERQPGTNTALCPRNVVARGTARAQIDLQTGPKFDAPEHESRRASLDRAENGEKLHRRAVLVSIGAGEVARTHAKEWLEPAPGW